MLKRLLLLFVLSLTLTTLSGQTDDPAKRKKELEQEIAQLDQQLSLNKSRQQSGMKDLYLIRRKIANRKRLLLEIEKEITKIDNQLEQKTGDIYRLENDLVYLKRQYSNLIYNAYKNRDQKMWLSYILSSSSLSQGYRRWVYFRDYAAALRSKADNIRGKKEQINQEKEELDKIKIKSLATKTDRQKEATKLEKERQSAQSLVNQLAKKEKDFRKQLASKKKEVERLNREIEKILSAAVKDREKPSFRMTPEDKLLSDNFGSNKGRLPWPVKKGEISEQFGQHYHPVFKNVKLPFNNGVNIATDPKANVYCVFDGVVKQVLVMPGYNQCVLIQHGNYFTFYCKLEKVFVKAGEKVKTGENIGSLAEDADGSEIHFQLWNGTSKQNPELWLKSR